ncbi:hypothetical protein CL617_01175 [archaeon]|nr:hypothetical protein [archaeon]|tara:strand:- start:3987 stop:5459 length:1473 start_codon:yes stop_codon:yes gene_type:complete
MKSKKISNRWLYIPILILGINFIIRIINQSKIIKQFPLDTVNDVSAYIAELHFLNICGFHNFCGYWYNGFTNFQLSTPGWHFFTYPIYLVFNDYLKAIYISIILIFLLSFIVIYIFGKINKINKEKRILFFFLLFANAAAIGNYIRLGRLPEFFSFFLFTLFAFIILYYKDRKLDWKFFSLIPIYSLIIFTHPTFAVISSFLWISILLVKNWESRVIIGATILTSLISISFWLIPYITNFYNSGGTSKPIGENLLTFGGSFLLENIASIIIPIIFLFIFLIYIKKKKYDKKEILFYSPIIVIALLLLSRLSAFIPILKYIYADVYMGFLIFFTLFIFFKSFKINKKVLIGITILVILSVSINFSHTPWFTEHTQLEKDTLEIMKDIDTSFLMTNSYSKTSYSKAYYSYAPIYFNITTPSGWAKVASFDYYNKLRRFSNSVRNKNCNNLIESAKILKNDYIISYNGDCDFLKTCNLKKINQINNICLYKFN